MDKRRTMPSSICQFRMNWTVLGEHCENVLYAHRLSRFAVLDPFDEQTWDDETARNHAARIMSAWDDADMLSFQHTDCNLDGVSYAFMSPGPEQSDAEPLLHLGEQGTVLILPRTNGSNEGEPFPNMVSVAVKLGTGFGGRAAHGRLFLTGINDGLTLATNSNILKADISDSLATKASDFISRWNFAEGVEAGDLSTIKAVVVSFVVGGAQRALATWLEILYASVIDNKVDSQVRRGPGHNRSGGGGRSTSFVT